MSWLKFSFEDSEQAEKFEDAVKVRIGPIAYRNGYNVTVDNNSIAPLGDEICSQLDHFAVMYSGKSI